MEKDAAIVVTGACGFIGSCMVRHLNNLGMTNLILVDDFGSSYKWKNLLYKRFKQVLGIGDLFSWLQGRESEVQAFIHLGACCDTLETRVDYLLEQNTRYTIRLAEYALKHGQRFIYASSAATYGDGSRGFSDDHRALQELVPLNPYGYSKHLIDLWALEQGVIEQIVGLKYFNVYGPNEWHKDNMASMICKVFPKVQKEGIIRLYKSTSPEKFADGGQCRDFIYVKDAVEMTAVFLENGKGGIYNIGSGEPSTWNRLASALFAALEFPCRIEYVDMPDTLASQYQNYTCADMRKFDETWGSKMRARYSLETAVRDYVEAHLMRGITW